MADTMKKFPELVYYTEISNLTSIDITSFKAVPLNSDTLFPVFKKLLERFLNTIVQYLLVIVSLLQCRPWCSRIVLSDHFFVWETGKNWVVTSLRNMVGALAW
jgi:hypothetical protein